MSAWNGGQEIFFLLPDSCQQYGRTNVTKDGFKDRQLKQGLQESEIKQRQRRKTAGVP